MAEAAQNTPSPEASLPPEQRAARLADTREVVTKLFRKKNPENPSHAEAQAIDADPAAKAIFTADYCSNLDEVTLQRGSISLEDGEPVQIEGSEGKGRLVSIVGVDGDNLKCKYETGSGDSAATFTESFSRNEIRNRVLVSERQAIEDGFSGEEQKVVKAYLDAIDPSVPPENRSLPSKETLQKAVESENIISSEHAQTLFDQLRPSQQNAPQMQAIKKRLEGRVFANAEDFAALAHVVFPDVDAIDDRIEVVRDERKDLQSQVDGLPDGDPTKATLKAKITDSQRQEAAFALAQLVLKEEQAIRDQEEAAAQAEAENSPIVQIDRALAVRSHELAATVTELSAQQNLTPEQQSELENAKKMLELFEATKDITGVMRVPVNEFLINQALVHAKGDKVVSAGILQLKRVHENQIHKARTEANTDLIATLEQAGVPPEQRAAAQEVFNSQETLMEFLSGETENPQILELLKNPDIKNTLFEGNTTLEIDTFLAAAENSLTKEQKAKMDMARKLLKGSAITAGGLALLILAVTGVAMSVAAKGFADNRRVA